MSEPSLLVLQHILRRRKRLPEARVAPSVLPDVNGDPTDFVAMKSDAADAVDDFTP